MVVGDRKFFPIFRTKLSFLVCSFAGVLCMRGHSELVRWLCSVAAFHGFAGHGHPTRVVSSLALSARGHVTLESSYPFSLLKGLIPSRLKCELSSVDCPAFKVFCICHWQMTWEPLSSPGATLALPHLDNITLTKPGRLLQVLLPDHFSCILQFLETGMARPACFLETTKKLFLVLGFVASNFKHVPWCSFSYQIGKGGLWRGHSLSGAADRFAGTEAPSQHFFHALLKKHAVKSRPRHVLWASVYFECLPTCERHTFLTLVLNVSVVTDRFYLDTMFLLSSFGGLRTGTFGNTYLL